MAQRMTKVHRCTMQSHVCVGDGGGPYFINQIKDIILKSS